LQYNVPGGKKNRGLALVYAYKLLLPNDQLTEENIRLARILAWCVELVRGFVLIYMTLICILHKVIQSNVTIKMRHENTLVNSKDKKMS